MTKDQRIEFLELVVDGLLDACGPASDDILHMAEQNALETMGLTEEGEINE